MDLKHVAHVGKTYLETHPSAPLSKPVSMSEDSSDGHVEDKGLICTFRITQSGALTPTLQYRTFIEGFRRVTLNRNPEVDPFC